MLNGNTPVVIRGYCGYIESYEATNMEMAAPFYNITLRDPKDPRIRIVMEDIRYDEL